MKKKLILCVMLLQVSSALFAQGNAKAEINSILNSWMVPVLALGLFGGFAALVWHNQDAIRGKNGLSKQDGWFAVGEGMIFVVFGMAAFTFVAGKLSGMSFTL